MRKMGGMDNLDSKSCLLAIIWIVVVGAGGLAIWENCIVTEGFGG